MSPCFAIPTAAIHRHPLGFRFGTAPRDHQGIARKKKNKYRADCASNVRSGSVTSPHREDDERHHEQGSMMRLTCRGSATTCRVTIQPGEREGNDHHAELAQVSGLPQYRVIGVKYHTGAICSGVFKPFASSKFANSRKKPPISGAKNSTAQKKNRNTAIPCTSCTE